MLFRSASGVTLLGSMLLVASSLLVERFDLLPAAWRPFVGAAPLILLALTLPLAWRFRRRRLALATLVLALLAQPGPWRGALFPAEEPALGVAWGWLVATHLALLALGREGPLVRAGTLVHALLIVASAWGLHRLAPGVSRLPETPLLAFPALPFACGAVFALAAALWTRRALPAALAVALLALALVAGGLLGVRDLPLLAAACQGALLLALLEESYRLAYHDALTGLPARRALVEEMEHLGGRYALAMVDIDHFKRFNDRHGHEVGDQVLRMVALELAGVGRGGQAFRYGGEEFAIVFQGRGAAEAREALDAVCTTIAGRRFVIRSRSRPRRKPRGKTPSRVGKRTVRITVSAGVSEPSRRRVLPREVLAAADKALYKAKRAGRNRVA